MSGNVRCVNREVQRRIVVEVDLKVSGFPEIAGNDKANRTKRNISFSPEDVLATAVSFDGGETWAAQAKVYGDIGLLVRGFAEYSGSFDRLPTWLADVLRDQLPERATS